MNLIKKTYLIDEDTNNQIQDYIFHNDRKISESEFVRQAIKARLNKVVKLKSPKLKNKYKPGQIIKN